MYGNHLQNLLLEQISSSAIMSETAGLKVQLRRELHVAKTKAKKSGQALADNYKSQLI